MAAIRPGTAWFEQHGLFFPFFLLGGKEPSLETLKDAKLKALYPPFLWRIVEQAINSYLRVRDSGQVELSFAGFLWAHHVARFQHFVAPYPPVLGFDPSRHTSPSAGRRDRNLSRTFARLLVAPARLVDRPNDTLWGSHI